MKSVVEQLFIRGEESPEKIALHNGKNQISYRNLTKEIISVRNLLHEKYCIKKGSHVILSADKQLGFVSAYFAFHLLEAVVLPIAPDTNQIRYEYIRDKAAPDLVIGYKDEKPGIHNVTLNDLIEQCDAIEEKRVSFPDMDSTADILFTTGTTGEPKGVLLTHRNIAAAARNINSFIRNESEDIEMLALPISHSFGLGRMRCALTNGQTLVMLGSFANVKRFFRFIDEYKVSGFGMVPASWALLKKLSGSAIGEFSDQIKYIEIGSAPMPMEEKKSLMKLLPNTRICMHYGLTEASRSAFIEFHSEINHLDTVGRESPNMHISIRDEKGNVLPFDTEGEICVSGDAVTKGYYDISSQESYWGESFRTGDWGTCNQEGYITLKSRKKELINVGGKKVSPVEVEEVLNSIDSVKECACVGVPDPDGILGDVVKAFIVTDDPSKVDNEYMDERIGNRLEGYKHPALYEIIDEVPKTTSGKIQRLALLHRESEE